MKKKNDAASDLGKIVVFGAISTFRNCSISPFLRAQRLQANFMIFCSTQANFIFVFMKGSWKAEKMHDRATISLEAIGKMLLGSR